MRCLVIFLGAAVVGQLTAAEPDAIAHAPSGEYSLVQSEPPPDRRPTNCEDGPCFQTVVRFSDRGKADVHLAGVGWGYEAKADYAISPDSRWIARHQHTGAGWSVLVVYRVEPNGQVWRLDGDIIGLALDQTFATLRTARKDAKFPAHDYTHISADPTMRWDRDSGLLRFQVFATPREVSEGKPPAHPTVAQWVDYDPKKHKIMLK